MTPILIVTQTAGQAPHVFWASDAHVVAASARLGEPDPLSFDAAWDRYAARYDKVRWFASWGQARLWAESYEGVDWLAIRAEIAKAEITPPNDLVFEEPISFPLKERMQNTRQRPPTLWTKSRGPILARPYTLDLAQAINQLLVSPIAVLPQNGDDPVRPFQIGIRPQILEQRKAEADPKVLDGAIRRYTQSQAYAFACAQPGAMRHDVDGEPVEPVSEADRLAATTRVLVNLRRRKQAEAKNAQDGVVTPPAT